MRAAAPWVVALIMAAALGLLLGPLNPFSGQAERVQATGDAADAEIEKAQTAEDCDDQAASHMAKAVIEANSTIGGPTLPAPMGSTTLEPGKPPSVQDGIEQMTGEAVLAAIANGAVLADGALYLIACVNRLKERGLIHDAEEALREIERRQSPSEAAAPPKQ